MSVRKKRKGGLDFYPTQPWATRALLEVLGLQEGSIVWEPACGGGHISQVLEDEGHWVYSTDIHDHGYRGQAGCGLGGRAQTLDFINGPRTILEFGEEVEVGASPFLDPDWIITNPPFQDDMGERFVLKALTYTPNVAVLCRLSWLEGKGRCHRLFGPTPPSRVIVLTERLGFDEGDCRVGKGGMIPYAWYVWEEGSAGTRLSWVGQGARDRLTRDDDAERFNGPVVRAY